jgi:hypothetical protein
MMPGTRLARVLMIVVAIVVAVGLVMGMTGAPAVP